MTRRHSCRVTLNNLSLRSYMRVFKIVSFPFAWNMDVAQKFLLGSFTLPGNLLRNGKNPLHDLEAVISKSPAFHFETCRQFHDRRNREHLQSRPRDLEGRRSSGEPGA